MPGRPLNKKQVDALITASKKGVRLSKRVVKTITADAKKSQES
jgi:hypothetical protein